MYTYSTCIYLVNKKYTLLLSKTECGDFYTLILLILKWLHNLVSKAFISFLSRGGGGMAALTIRPPTNQPRDSAMTINYRRFRLKVDGLYIHP
jgi:hypothetical protein